jgi:subtilisin family serine protease
MRNTHPLPDTPQPQNWGESLISRPALIALAIVSVLLLILAGVGAWYVFYLRPSTLSVGPEITPPASLDELATQYPELSQILQDPKLDSAYKDFFLAYQKGGPEAALEMARSRGLINDQDELRLTLELDTLDTAPLVEQLEGRGIQVTAVSDNLIDVAIPLSLIDRAMESGEPGSLFQGIIGLEHVKRIRLPRINIQDADTKALESLPVIHADAWQVAGLSGKGVKIGVLDMGFNRYREFLGTNLPAQVTAKSFIAGHDIDDASTEHGTAVAEIIHRIAPEAELFFTAYETDVELRQAVDWLVAQKVNIISHSAGSIYGPMNGKGSDARMVDRVVAGGVLWVNSAGNTGDTHYRGTFTDKDGDGFHEFKSNDETMQIVPKGQVTLALNWDAWDTCDQDYDLFVLDRAGNKIASSENVQNGSGCDAAEIITYDFRAGGSYYVAFYASHITRPGVLDFYIYDSEIEFVTPDHSTTTPADSRSSLTVGATFWENDAFEVYSSQGPTNDGRIKPDISAPAGVYSDIYREAFYGTSASAPHVSAAAALVWQAYPDFSVQQVADFLKSRARDLGPVGLDNMFGYGRLWLGDAPGAAARPPSTETSLPLNPTARPSATIPATAATRSPTPTVTPAPAASLNNRAALSLGLIAACVAIPALLGLGGLGLLGGVWYLSRREKAGKTVIGSPGAHVIRRPADLGSGALVGVGGRCPHCGNPTRYQARFCSACGLPLTSGKPIQAMPLFCKHCGQPLRPSSRFCLRCGRRL